MDSSEKQVADGGRLADNIVHFGRVLRRAGIRVGPAAITDADAFPEEVTAQIFRGHVLSDELKRRTRIIRVTPLGEFVTFGVAMPILKMRKVEEAQGRAPCGTTLEMAAAQS